MALPQAVFLKHLALGVWLAAAAAPHAAAAPPHQVPDSIAQRVEACTVCHGKEGRATNQGYFPRIAGKPAGYLYNQLVNFRDGHRSNGTMTYLVEYLSDAYLQEMADYFAAMELPYPAPQTTGASSEVLQRGEALVRRGSTARNVPACVACHGSAMTGVAPAVPGLLGLPRDYLVGQFGNWKTGLRKAAAPDCMAQVATRLSVDDIGAVATWLSSQPLPEDARPASAPAAPLPLHCGSMPGQ